MTEELHEAYVYALIDNRPDSTNYNEPFYIGMSSFVLKYDHHKKYQRAYSHFTKSSIEEQPDDPKNIVIKDILSRNLKPEIHILHEHLTTIEAAMLEMQYIKEYGRMNINTGILTNLSPGGEGITKPTKDRHAIRRYYNTINKIQHIRDQHFEEEVQNFLHTKTGPFCILCVIKAMLQYKNLVNQPKTMRKITEKNYYHVIAALKPENRERSSKMMTAYNKSEHHRQSVAYHNSIHPKISSTASRIKLAISQKNVWDKKTPEKRKKDSDNMMLGKAYNVMKRIEGDKINARIYNEHRTQGSRTANAEPIWESLIKRFETPENILKRVEENFGRKFIYEN